MKAAIYHGPGDIRIEEVKDPKVNPEGAVLKVHACGVCNVMDIDAWVKMPPGGLRTGLALGHEWSGELVEVGSKVTDFKVGDKIFQNPVFQPCYKCESCLEGHYWRCVNWRDGLSGRAKLHGGFAEYIWIPFITNESAAKMPDTLGYHDLALIEPVYLGVGLAQKAKPGDVVVVVGSELIGLTAIAKLKEKGIKVIASDISEKRLQAAEELGADVVVNELQEDLVQVVMKETAGRGADIVLLIDSRPISLLEAMGSVRRAGKIWVATYYYSPFKVSSALRKGLPDSSQWHGPGTTYTEPDVGFDPALLHMQIAWGTLGPRVPRWHEAAQLIQSGKISAEKHVSHVFPLEKIKEAFEVTDTQDSVKVIVEL